MFIKQFPNVFCAALLTCCLLEGGVHYPPVPIIHGSPAGVIKSTAEDAYTSVALLLSQGYRLNHGYVKPIIEEARTTVRDSLPCLPSVLHELVLEYTWWHSIESRCNGTFKDGERRAASNFHLQYSKLAEDNPIGLRAYYASFEVENKDFWSQTSHIDFLRNVLTCLVALQPAYESSPYQFRLGSVMSNSCILCGESSERVADDGASSSIYTFDYDKIAPIVKAFSNVDTAMLLQKSMKRSVERYECSCSMSDEAIVREKFIILPRILLLHFDRNPLKKVAVSRYIELYRRLGQPPAEYELYGATFVNSMQNGGTSISTQLKYSDTMWHLHHADERKKLKDPFNHEDELISYLITRDDKCRETSKASNVVDVYPELMLYKRK